MTDILSELNKTIDIGALTFTDTDMFINLDEKETAVKTTENINKFFSAMFKYKNSLPNKGVLEYATPYFSIPLPEVKEQLPRLMPIPKEKPKTRWEKFREERGLGNQAKKSKKVWDDAEKKWVRRYGYMGKTYNEKKRDWLIEAKPGEEHIDPFEKKANEKKFMLEKEKMKAIKNQMRAAGVNMKLLREGKGKYGVDKTQKKRKRSQKKERKDKEVLENTLKVAKISTGSMGIYDKKASKYEKDAPIKRKKKKETNIAPSKEKERSLNILKIMKKRAEIKGGVINDDVLVRKKQAERDSLRAKTPKPQNPKTPKPQTQ